MRGTGWGLATRALVAAALLMVASGARADDQAPAAEEAAFDQPSIATSFGQRPDGPRAKLGAAGLRWHAIYTGDLLTNLSGGISRGTTYGGRLELGVEADLEKLIGWTGATVTATGFLIHGRGMSRDHLGNLLAVSNAEALPAARLFELWLEQKIGSFASIRIGQLAADSEFITSENAGLFINGTFGWPGITAANLPSGGPAYPLATPGARVELNLGPKTKFRAAVFNGDPAGPGAADPQRLNRHGVNFRLRDDPFLIAELQHSYALGSGPSALPGTVKIGAWYHTGSFSDQRFDTIGLSLADPASTGIPASLRGNWGPYAIFDQMLLRLSAERSIGAFGRVSLSPDDRSLVSFYADAGITVKGPIPTRPDDTFGIAFGYAQISDRARAFDRDTILFAGALMPVRDYEAVLEITYQAQIIPGWIVQPDFQYLIRPGGNVPDPTDPTGMRPVRNAAVVGVRSVVRY